MAERMKVRALQGVAGKDFVLRPGDEYEGEAAEMARWCERGIAVPVKATRKKATKPKPEKAVTDE